MVAIMRGKEDEWMLKERGEAALDYLNFERMLILISLIINGLSLVALLVNKGGGKVDEAMEDMWQHKHYLTPFVNSTSMWNLKEDSEWHFYHVIVSFLLPYLVLLAAYLFLPTCLTAEDNPPSRWAAVGFGTDLDFHLQHPGHQRPRLQGAHPHGDPELLPADASPCRDQVAQAAKHQLASLIHTQLLNRTITWGKDTRKLRRLLWRLDFAQVDADHLGIETNHVCPGGEEMAGEPTPKVLAVFCSMLWKEGPRLRGGQGGDTEATDLTGAGGSLQVCSKQNGIHELLNQDGQ